MPLVQSSAFAFDSADELAAAMAGPDGAYVYGRRGNPTVRALERTLADLEGGASAIAFASGMGAISGVLLALLRPGDRVVAQRCLYGGTYAALTDLAERFGVEVAYIGGDDVGEFEALIGPRTRLLLLETIANPTAQVPDLPGLLAAARRHGVLGAVDNSLASPVLCRPIELGADIVLHSTTKYLAGHSDVIGGAAVFADDALRRQVWPRTVELGASADPFAAWLTLRGIATLPLRMRAHCANAALLAERLSGHPAVTAVHWPWLGTHPSRDCARAVLSGGGGLLSFELEGGRDSRQGLRRGGPGGAARAVPGRGGNAGHAPCQHLSPGAGRRGVGPGGHRRGPGADVGGDRGPRGPVAGHRTGTAVAQTPRQNRRCGLLLA